MQEPPQVTHFIPFSLFSDEEEREVYPVAGRILDEDQKRMLAKEYREDMERRRST